MDQEIFITKENLATRFEDALLSQERASYSFLIGAGFSRSAGIPLARDIVGILAAYKIAKLRHSTEKLSDVILRVLRDESMGAEAVKDLVESDKRFADLDYSQLYSRLFDDPRLFPNQLISQAQFVAELLEAAEHMALGWNFESLYLGFLCSQLHDHPWLKINTILTTNFDNVLVNSFSHIDGHFRILDHPYAIMDDTFSTPYPRLLYLHGRYLHYRVTNSGRDVESLLDQLKEDTKNRKKDFRLEAIVRGLRSASEGGGLIVIGYAGWEDAIMKVLERELQHDGFKAGIIWCHKDGPETVRPAIVRLAQETRRIEIVPEVSALEMMQCLLEATGFSESEVIRRLQRKGAMEYADLRKRWVTVQERRHNVHTTQETEVEVAPAVSLAEVEKVCGRALLDSRFSALAFELLREYLSSISDIPVKVFANLVRRRAELRVLYSGKPKLAIADFYAVVGLEPLDEELTFLGLTDAYRQLGQFDKAGICLMRAYAASKKYEDSLGLARCQYMDAVIRFELQSDILNAERLCSEAVATFEQEGRLDLRAKCFGLQAAMCGFNYQGNEGLGYAQRALDDARESHDRIMECKAHLLEGYCYATLGDFDKAARAFEAARDIAVEGPQYRTLANIDVLLSDVRFAQGEMNESNALLEEAIEYFGFVADVRNHGQAILTRLFNRLQLQTEATLEVVGELTARVIEFEKYEDEALSTSQWLAFVASVLRLKNRGAFKEVVNQSVQRSRLLAESFEEKGRLILRDMARQNSPQGARERHDRLIRHVIQQSQVTELLPLVFGEGVEKNDAWTEEVRRLYASVVAVHQTFGFSSRTVEVLMAILSVELGRSSLLPLDKILLYRPNAELTDLEVREFCRVKGGLPFADLIR
jgi:tetratricopeptide (TPR) repeat protein